MSGHIWIKANDEPLRYEYGEANDDMDDLSVREMMASVEADRSGLFQWTTYMPPIKRGIADDRLQAQKRAQEDVTRRSEPQADPALRLFS